MRVWWVPLLAGAVAVLTAKPVAGWRQRLFQLDDSTMNASVWVIRAIGAILVLFGVAGSLGAR